uniref:Uncharacterized protein n=1 Tax=Oryza sativa subsp. japonica TaxID=39947 RepID=Q6YSX4_ORYSJ|nr:hypothetical protein [Oryza sativa Japonica Group]BAD32001.1 hypothetical protein [Oryza sativa Japonica Group]
MEARRQTPREVAGGRAGAAAALAAAQRAFCLPLAWRVLAAEGTGNAAVSAPVVHISLALGCDDGGRGGAADTANVASRVVKRVLKDQSTSGGLAAGGGVCLSINMNSYKL